MGSHTAIVQPVAAMSQMAARLALAAVGTFLVLLAALHVLKPELDPSWRVISEYALGRYGSLMTLAFLSLALSCASLAIALRPHIRSIGGKIGLAFLLLSAVGITIAGIMPTDPITTSRDALTPNGRLHELGALLDVTPFAALLISWSLARRNPAWSSARRVLFWTAGLPVLGLMVFIASVALMLPGNGAFGPDVLIGWPNRLMMVAYCAWLMTVAWQAIRLGRQQS
jgi:hypothetical protein